MKIWDYFINKFYNEPNSSCLLEGHFFGNEIKGLETPIYKEMYQKLIIFPKKGIYRLYHMIDFECSVAQLYSGDSTNKDIFELMAHKHREIVDNNDKLVFR